MLGELGELFSPYWNMRQDDVKQMMKTFTTLVSGWWLGPTPLKNMSESQLGWKKMFQTTNQVCIFCILSDRLVVLPSVA